jgi:dCMP deaminase
MNNIINAIKQLDKRPTWDEYFVILTLAISKRSSCNKLHVGCIIVKDNNIISTGYNGHVRGAEHKSVIIDNHEQMTIHAEANAVGIAASNGTSVNGATAYITHYPCINCAKMLITSGIKEIRYLEDYKNNDICKILFEQAKLKVVKINTH